MGFPEAAWVTLAASPSRMLACDICQGICSEGHCESPMRGSAHLVDKLSLSVPYPRSEEFRGDTTDVHVHW